jgi:hypothetical protein
MMTRPSETRSVGNFNCELTLSNGRVLPGAAGGLLIEVSNPLPRWKSSQLGSHQATDGRGVITRIECKAHSILTGYITQPEIGVLV